jgi:hypothetical protein
VRFQQDLMLSEQLGTEYEQLVGGGGAGAGGVVIDPEIVVAAADDGVPQAPPLDDSAAVQVYANTGRRLIMERVRRAREMERAREEELAHQVAAMGSSSRNHLYRGGGGGGLPGDKDGPEIVQCGICQEDVHRNTTVVFGRQYFFQNGRLNLVVSDAANAACKHRFCRECVKDYLTHEINNGQVMRLKCPGRRPEDNGPCPCVAPSRWLREQVGPDTFAKFERFLQLRQDQSFRSCPNAQCLHVQQRGAKKPKGDAGGSDAMECEKCGTVYCFAHDLAHVGGSCADYARKLAVESSASLEHIASHTVTCPWPTCRVKVVKESGCNHMTCSECHTHFCYLCGGLYLGGLHYAPCNFLGCPGMKNEDLGPNTRNSWPRTIAKIVFGLPLMLLVIALILAAFFAMLAVYIVWLVGLSPLWIIVGLVLYTANRRSENRMPYHRSAKLQRWNKRFKRCVGWGAKLTIGILQNCC